MRSIAGRLRFQPSRSAPSLPHQAPAERGENTGIPKASKPRKSLRLDPLENGIRKERTFREESANITNRAFFGPIALIGWRVAQASLVLFCMTREAHRVRNSEDCCDPGR
jgi:hypothetical protein